MRIILIIPMCILMIAGVMKRSTVFNLTCALMTSRWKTARPNMCPARTSRAAGRRGPSTRAALGWVLRRMMK